MKKQGSSNILLVAALLGVSAYAIMDHLEDKSASESSPAPTVSSPAPIVSAPAIDAEKVLGDLGFQVVSDFPVNDAITGYGIIRQGQSMSAYTVPDTSYLIVGEMITPEGLNLSQKHREKNLEKVLAARAWPMLEESHFFDDALNHADDSIPLMYSIMDPNCPYCMKFWKDTRELVENGELRIRHVMVGVLGEDSVNKSGAILAAENPDEAFEEYMQARWNVIDEAQASGTKPEPMTASEAGLGQATPETKAWLNQHRDIMTEANSYGTPTSFVRLSDGSLRIISGYVDAETLRNILSPEL